MDFRCDGCGRGFKSSQGLASHQLYCKKVQAPVKSRQPLLPAGEDLKALKDKLLGEIQARDETIETLSTQVEYLLQAVSPAGKNLVGVCSSRIIELTARVADLAKRIDAQKGETARELETLEREIKGWVFNVIPETWRPK